MSKKEKLFNASDLYVGLNSFDFLVQLFGDTLDADQTFTPYATGFAATFSPASLVIPAGVDFGVFSVLASSAGSGQVGVTSSGLTVAPVAVTSHGTYSFLPASNFASTASIAFASDGTLSGSFAVGSIVGSSGSQSITGRATFSFATPVQYTRSYSYRSGSLSVVGTLPGKSSSPETLLSLPFLACCLDDADAVWTFAPYAMGTPSVAADVTGTFGGVTGFAFLTMSFTGSPGSSGCVLTSAKISVMN